MVLEASDSSGTQSKSVCNAQCFSVCMVKIPVFSQPVQTNKKLYVYTLGRVQSPFLIKIGPAGWQIISSYEH